MNPNYPVLLVQYGLQADDIQAYGFLGTSTNPDPSSNGIGGGAIQMGHGLTVTSDMPCIVLEDIDFQTRSIKRTMETQTHTQLTQIPWGDLELGNLYVNGFIQAASGTWLALNSPVTS